MIVVCGKQTLSPCKMKDTCREHPLVPVYALPWVSTMGELNGSFTSRQRTPSIVTPCSKNYGSAGIQEFDTNLCGDAFGNMASIVGKGFPVLNKIMTCPFDSQFYGKVLVPFGAETYLIDCRKVHEYFPLEPISAKLYAASTVAVEFDNTDEFSKVSKTNADTVNVILASDFLPGSIDFINFYHAFTSRLFVGIRDLSDFNSEKIPIVHYNGLGGTQHVE